MTAARERLLIEHPSSFLRLRHERIRRVSPPPPNPQVAGDTKRAAAVRFICRYVLPPEGNPLLRSMVQLRIQSGLHGRQHRTAMALSLLYRVFAVAVLLLWAGIAGGSTTSAEQGAALLKEARERQTAGGVFDAIVLYRVLIETAASEELKNAARADLADLASRLRARNLDALAGELNDYLSKSSPTNADPLGAFPQRGPSESTALFDGAARGTLAAPSSQLTADQQRWRSLLGGAVAQVASNVSAGVVGRPNRDVLMHGVLDGLTGIDTAKTRRAVDALRSNDQAAAISALSELLEKGADGSTGAEFGPSSPSAQSSGACRRNLAHIAGSLPRYDLPQLTQLREQILREDIPAAMQKARSQGLTPHQAAAQTLAAARNSDAERRKATACIVQFSDNPQAVIQALETGRYRFGSPGVLDSGQTTRPIHQSCASMYVTLYYAATATKELAVQMACHAAQVRP